MANDDRADLLLKAALTYAARGWAVFPVHTPVEVAGGMGCSCRRDDCGNAGKHPRTMNGFKDASTDQAQIEKWWGMWPLANIAIACGASKLTVIDVDPKNGGDETFRDLVVRYGSDVLTETVICLTGSLGNHYYFNAGDTPLKSSVGAWQGIDIRGYDGYVVAPPSLHESGRLYEWERPASKYELAAFPDIAIETQRTRARGITTEPGAQIPQGKRDDVLASLAGAMRQKGMGEEGIFAALRAENAERCVPPLPESDLRRIARSVARYEPSRDIPVGRLAFTKTYARLRKQDTKPPSFVVTVMGQDVFLDSVDSLVSHSALQKRVLEQISVLVPSLTKREWETELSVLTDAIEDEYAPDDASESGIVWNYITSFLERADDDVAGLEEGRPVLRDTYVLTNGEQLRKHLLLHNFKVEPRLLWSIAKEHGARSQVLRVKEDVKRFWAIPTQQRLLHEGSDAEGENESAGEPKVVTRGSGK